MFPVDRSFVYVAYLQCAVIGLTIGVLSGILTSIVAKLRIRGPAIAIDALIGAIGSVVAADVLWRVGFGHNFIAALAVSAVLPVLHHLSRLRRHRPEN